MKSIHDLIQDVTCLCRKVSNLTRLNRIVTISTDDYVIGKGDGVVVLTGPAVDPKLPDPAINRYRRITVANYSTGATTVVSHNGSSVLRGATGAATSNVAIAAAAGPTTAGSRLTFHSDGTVWWVINN